MIQNSVNRILRGATRRFSNRGSQRDDGAAMVELAFVLVLLVMLLVGTVNAALAFGRGNSIQNAAREASRYAATLPEVESNFSDVVSVARSAAAGDLETTAPGYFICVAYLDEGGTWHRSIDGTFTPPASNCYDDQRPGTEERVQVVAGRETTIEAVVFSTDITLSAEASARYER